MVVASVLKYCNSTVFLFQREHRPWLLHRLKCEVVIWLENKLHCLQMQTVAKNLDGYSKIFKVKMLIIKFIKAIELVWK